MKLTQKIWEKLSSTKQSAKLLALSGVCAGALLTSCSDNNKITLDHDKQSASYSLAYEGHREQHFYTDIAIRKLNDSTFIVEIDEGGLSNDKTYRGNNPDALLHQVAKEFSDRIPLNTSEDNRSTVIDKIHKKTDFVASEYQRMLKNPQSGAKKTKIIYQPSKTEQD